MISIHNNEKCYGCTACEAVCKIAAIEMVEDSEGFLYPKVDVNKCVKCGKCIKACPYLSNPDQNQVLNVYATQNKNETIRKESSSGGTFTLLCENIINNKGHVFGCGLDKNCNATHINIQEISDIKILSNSWISFLLIFLLRNDINLYLNIPNISLIDLLLILYIMLFFSLSKIRVTIFLL